jgi:hypothetical protein
MVVWLQIPTEDGISESFAGVERKTLTESLQIITAVWRGLKKKFEYPPKVPVFLCQLQVTMAIFNASI